MKCPHCLEQLTYRERSNQVYPKCHQRFALEPRSNRWRLSDLRLRALAKHLSRDGQYSYTPLQMAHAVLLQELRPKIELQIKKKRYPWPMSRRPIKTALALSVLVGSMSFALLFVCVWLSLFDLLCAAMIMLLFGASMALGTYLVYRYPFYNDQHHLETDFEHKYIEPWEAIHGPLQGRITGNNLESDHVQIDPAQVRAVVISPVPDVIACLRANGLPQRLKVALINLERDSTEAIEWLLPRLRLYPQIPILLLHDASVDGCLLSIRLPTQWQLSPEHRTIDLGLRPRHVRDLHLPWRVGAFSPLPVQRMAELERAMQAVGRPVLDRDELTWLSGGPTTSILFVPPARLVEVVVRAVERYAPVADPETLAQAQARAVGYLTWPQSRGYVAG